MRLASQRSHADVNQAGMWQRQDVARVSKHTLRASSVASAPLLYDAHIFSSSFETVVHSSAW